MAKNVTDQELQQYRDLMPPPDHFESGFSIKMLVAALFLGFIMVPGSIYLSLFSGASLGPAAQWVTIILFAEVAKRSMKSLKQQEIYLLFYMTGIALAGSAHVHGGLLSQLLWNQYLVQAPATNALGVASEIPYWVAPQQEVIEGTRTFFTSHWLSPILFIVGLMVVQRVDRFGLGYALYRLTSHVEKLPFPMAPVGALGITALAESKQSKERWRWRCFSLGAVLGAAFGALYLGVPTITQSLFGRTVQVIPIPWIDFTHVVSTESFMPATPLNLVFDLTFFILGMVLPFWAVVGGFVGLLITWTLNPFLYDQGVLTTWQPGMKVVDTLYSNHIDFYLSFGIGLALSIFLFSVFQAIRPLIANLIWPKSKEVDEELEEERASLRELFVRNKERGDLSIWLALAIYVGSSLTYILISSLLLWNHEKGWTDFPVLFFTGFAFLYQPVISYVNAKLEGTVGQTVQIPMIREAAFIFSGYKGAEIWFCPIPMTDYGRTTQFFRVLELTGTKLTDVIKVEFLTVPILAVTSLLFCELIWRLAPIPGPAYPFTQEVWDLQARMFALQITATTEGTSEFLEAIKFDVIGWGLGLGMFGFIFLTFLNLPTFLVYGAVRGLGQTSPGHILFELAGAMVGRFYFQRKFGHEAYKKYVMVLFAGFSAGVGLIAMGAVAFALIAKSTTPLGF